MRRDPYKERKFREFWMTRAIGAAIIFMIILIVVIIVSLNERSKIYLEGATKAIPLMRDETLAELGAIYVEMEDEFEAELNRIILGVANRKNKRGDSIFYGVNGRDNKDMLINEDYVNGVNLKYIKSDSSKKDGESNYNDMLAVIAALYGEDADRYKEDVKDTFRYLFEISHSYKAESTELYACKHGCEEVMYYCGDSMIQGEYGGDTVGHYNSDLKYQPFKIKSHNKYSDLQMQYDEMTEGKLWEINVDFDVEDYEGICEVDSEGKTVFGPSKNTTKSFAGCHRPGTYCYHGNPLYAPGVDGAEPTLVCEHSLGSSHEGCSNYEMNARCSYDGEGDHNCHAGEVLVDEEGNPILDENGEEQINLGCGGYYECKGHEHWNCHGHVLICCFGHTTLNLDVNILYYEAMIDELKKQRQ